MVATIASNLQSVRSRIDAAARRVGREPSHVRLIAVSKTFGVDHVRAAWSAGQREFGENKVQEALEKIGDTADMAIRWHLIGHLQSNKARKAAGAFACIHSVDSVDLLRKLDAAAMELVSTTVETSDANHANELYILGAASDVSRRFDDASIKARAVRLAGLMLIPPWNEDQEQTRPWFRRLRDLRDTWLAEGVPADSLAHLSMGMSHDFEAAIEEGATLVRVGTAIFGKRTYNS